MLIAGVVVVVLIAIGVAVWVVASNRSDSVHSVDTCVTLAMASSMGGGVEHACGKAAHDWCRAAYAQQGVHAQAVQVQCRHVGILP